MNDEDIVSVQVLLYVCQLGVTINGNIEFHMRCVFFTCLSFTFLSGYTSSIDNYIYQIDAVTNGQ